jgi:hypothetical protein
MVFRVKRRMPVMRIFVLVSLCSVSFLGFSASANASVEAYCEAYAIDFANLSETDEARWQVRREEAHVACIEQYRDVPAVVKEKPKPKRDKAVTVAEKVPLESQPLPVAKPDGLKLKKIKVAAKTENLEKKTVSAKKPNLKEGSPEWYDYCDRKYASFDRRSGKYISKTGVERKCLVTADFQ